MAFNVKRKLLSNIEAVKIALSYRDDQPLTPEEIDILKSYAGWGGIKSILLPFAEVEEWKRLGATKEDLRLYETIQEFHIFLKTSLSPEQYVEIFNSIKNSVLTSFYTPAVVPDAVYAAIADLHLGAVNLYEPSAGAGVFITTGLKALDNIQRVTAIEKDLLTGKILRALSSSFDVPTLVRIEGFEESPDGENGKSNLIISNIPFGNFSVFDPDPFYRNPVFGGIIHNYFFVKALSKIEDGGILAFLTTDAFLNTPSNREAREFVFRKCNFLSLTVMPDNLMKDSSNTEAPSHLLIVQKNIAKRELSREENRLIKIEKISGASGSYNLNAYIADHRELILGDEIKDGQNQYGKANLSVWLNEPVESLFSRLKGIISRGFEDRFDHQLFPVVDIEEFSPGQFPGYSDQSLTFLEPPAAPSSVVPEVQLGLFDVLPAETINEAQRYLSKLDRTVIDGKSVRIIGTVSSPTYPEHDSIVLLHAKSLTKGVYYYRLYSNLQEINVSSNWFNIALLPKEIKGIVETLKDYPQYEFKFSGEKSFNKLFAFQKIGPQYVENIRPLLKQESLFEFEGRIGIIKEIDHERNRAVFQALTEVKHVDFYRSYLKVRNTYLDLFDHEHNHQKENIELRHQLNKEYDDFVETNGNLQFKNNLDRLLIADGPFAFSIAHSLEIGDGNQFVKADIFRKSLIKKSIYGEKFGAIESLSIGLNDKGVVNLDYMAEISGLSPAALINELNGQIYYNTLLKEWEPVDKFISGNVVEKLKATALAAKHEPGNQWLKDSLAAIKQAQPKLIPFEILDFNLGERWIPIQYYNQFLSDFFGKETTLTYSRVLDTFEVNYKRGAWNSVNDSEFFLQTISGQKVYGHTLMQYAFENTAPSYTYTIGSGETKVTHKDSKATHLAYEKIATIRKRFEGWIRERPDSQKLAIETLYNETYNNTVIRKFDGTHLKFLGLDLQALGIPDLYDSQKNAIWRLIQCRGGLIDHEVGLGKTLTMVVASYEMKRLGIINKPMIVVLKSTVKQIVETYRQAYPGAKLLSPKEGDFDPKKRASMFYQIKNNDWDCIILTHEQFGLIPQSDEIRKEVLNDELKDVEGNYNELVSGGKESSKALLKGLEIRKTNLKNDLLLLAEEIESRKDKTVTFSEMGVDHLFVDESHKFKNLLMNTRHQRVAGLGNSGNVVKKTMSMLYAVRELQKKFNSDLCVTFCSGTPISNSIKEMYLIFKYLVPNELKRMQIENFDSWIAVFGRKSVDFEFSVTNDIIAKERFRYFIKVQELALLYNNITDYRRASEVNIDRPEVEEVLVNIPPTPAQVEYIANLQHFAKSGDGSVVGYKGGLQVDSKKGGLMLIATNLALKMTADMRLIYPGMEDHPNSKINQCAIKVAQHWKETAHFKGTQIVFSDIGTPGDHKDFDLYNALKTKLVEEFGIPAEEITFIHDWTDAKRHILYQKMNDGEIRLLFGSTEKAGTGLNIQSRIVAVHHIDVPWKPSSFEQRNGRGGRKGNWAAKQYLGNKIKAYIYAVQQSLDSYKFNLLKIKQTFISQIKSNSLGVRSIDEGAMDEENGMNYSEFLAVLSGDNSLLEKTKIEKKIAALESLKQTSARESIDNRMQLQSTISDALKKREALKKLTEEYEHYKSVLKHSETGAKENPINLLHFTGAQNEEQIGKYLIDFQKSWTPAIGGSDKEKIGTLYSYDLYIYVGPVAAVIQEDGSTELMRPNKYMIKSPRTGLSFTSNDGFVNENNPKFAARYFLTAIDRVESVKHSHEKEVRMLEEKVAYFESIQNKPFDKEKELQTLKDELTEIERVMNEKITPKPELNIEPEKEEEKEVLTETRSGFNVVKQKRGHRPWG